MNNSNAIDQFIKFYKNFSVEDINQFNSVYDKEIIFQDPFHCISGRDELLQYFKKMMLKVSGCRFDIHEITFDDATEGKERSAIVTWDMYFKHKVLNGGKKIVVNGATHLRYDDKIIFHRDYFDAGQLLYKNIPLLGSVIRLIERGM